MKHRNLILPAAALLLLATGGVSVAQTCSHGHSGHDHQKAGATGHAAEGEAHRPAGLHGGLVHSAEGRHFETVVSGGEVRVYLYDSSRTPLPAAKLQGTATVRRAGHKAQVVRLGPAASRAGEPTAYYCPMHAEATSMEPGECDLCGGMKLLPQDFLLGELDLGAAPAGPAKVAVTIEGIGGKGGKVAFEQQIELAGGAAAGAHSTH